MKHLALITVLMNTAKELKTYTTDSAYARLFDSLMCKMENQFPLFEYIYEQVKFNMFELVDIEVQKEEFIRLINLDSLEGEFNNSLNQYLQCLNG